MRSPTGAHPVRRVRLPSELLESRPEILAPLAGLEDIGDDVPGISRRRCGRGFCYVAPDGATIRPPERQRLVDLAVPPAWEEVWFCSTPQGYLQAAGRDDAGRKQYRYHDAYSALRSAQKFERLRHFPRALVRLRRFIAAGLDEPAGSRERAVAAVLRLLDVGLVRIGNDESAAEGSYGATTLRAEHVDASDSVPVLSFPAKSGIEQEVQVDDDDLAELLSRAGELKRGPVFRHEEDGVIQAVTPEDVNDAIAGCIGPGFSAKDFRTWGGSRAALEARVAGASEVEAVDAAADELGNTRAVARSSYVHPRVLAATDDEIQAAWSGSRSSVTRSRGDSALTKLLASGGAGFPPGGEAADS